MMPDDSRKENEKNGSFEILNTSIKSLAKSVEIAGDSRIIKEAIPDLDDLLATSSEEKTFTDLPSLQLIACVASDLG